MSKLKKYYRITSKNVMSVNFINTWVRNFVFASWVVIFLYSTFRYCSLTNFPGNNGHKKILFDTKNTLHFLRNKLNNGRAANYAILCLKNINSLEVINVLITVRSNLSTEWKNLWLHISKIRFGNIVFNST